MATYDMRRVGNAQGVPAMQKANTRGFDPRQFKPPTGEEEREDEEREEEEEDGGWFDSLLTAIGLTDERRGAIAEGLIAQQELDRDLVEMQQREWGGIKTLDPIVNPIITGERSGFMGTYERMVKGAEERHEGDPTLRSSEEHIISPVGWSDIPLIGDKLSALDDVDIPVLGNVIETLPDMAREEVANPFNYLTVGAGIPLKALAKSAGPRVFTNIADKIVSNVKPEWAPIAAPITKAGAGTANVPFRVFSNFIDPLLSNPDASLSSRAINELTQATIMGSTGMGVAESIQENENLPDQLALPVALAASIVTGGATKAPLKGAMRKAGLNVGTDIKDVDLRTSPKVHPDLEESVDSNVVAVKSKIGIERAHEQVEAQRRELDAEVIPEGKRPLPDPTAGSEDFSTRGYDTLVSTPRNKGEFIERVKRSQANGIHGRYVEVPESIDDLDLLFVSKDQDAGAYVTPDNELRSWYSAPDAVGADEVLRQASSQALTAVEKDVEGIIDRYAPHGWKPVARIVDTRSSPYISPEPDTVYMVRDTNDVLEQTVAIPSDTAGDVPIYDYASIKESVPVVETVEQARALQNQAKLKIGSIAPPLRPPYRQVAVPAEPLPPQYLTPEEYKQEMTPFAEEVAELWDVFPTGATDDALRRKAAMGEFLSKEGWSDEAGLRLAQELKHHKYIGPDGIPREWEDLPMLWSGRAEVRMFENEYNQKAKVVDSWFAGQQALRQGLLEKKVIPWQKADKNGVYKPTMKSLDELMDVDGRWKPETRVGQPHGFVDYVEGTGQFRFEGEVGRIVTEILEAATQDIKTVNALEDWWGISPEYIQGNKSPAPESVIKLMDAMWRNGEMPFVADTWERGMEIADGYMPRLVTLDDKVLPNDFKSSRVRGIPPEGTSGLGVYDRYMWENAPSMANGGKKYVTDLNTVIGSRVKAGIDSVLRKWSEESLLKPVEGRSSSLQERLLRNPRWAVSRRNLASAQQTVKNITARLLTQSKKLTMAERQVAARERRAGAYNRAVGGFEQASDAAKIKEVDFARRLLDEIKPFMPAFRQIGDPAVKGQRGTAQQPVLRNEVARSRQLTAEVKKLEAIINRGADSKPSDIDELIKQIDKVNELFILSRAQMDTFLKTRPKLRAAIDGTTEWDPNKGGPTARDSIDMRRVDLDLHRTNARLGYTRDLLARQKQAEMSMPNPDLAEIESRYARLAQELDEAELQLQRAKADYQNSVEAAGRLTGRDVVFREVPVLDPTTGAPMRHPPTIRDTDHGQVIEQGDIITETVTDMVSGEARKANGLGRQNIHLDKDYGNAVDEFFMAHGYAQRTYGMATGPIEAIMDLADNYNSNMRALMATADISGTAIQGLYPAGFSLPVWAKAQKYAMFSVANPRVYYRYLTARPELLKRFIRAGGHLSGGGGSDLSEFLVKPKQYGMEIGGKVPWRNPLEKVADEWTIRGDTAWQKTGSIFDALTYPARKLASYPINAANMHFSVLGDVLRLELFALEESNVSAMSIIRGGTGSLAKAQTQKERENAAELINNMTGWAKEAPSDISRLGLFAGRFFRSQLQTMDKAIGELGTDSPEGRMAAVAVARTLISFMTFTMIANELQGYDTDTDLWIQHPTKPDSLMFNRDAYGLHVGSTRTIQTLGSLHSMLAAVADMAPFIGDPAENTMRSVLSKASPITNWTKMFFSEKTWSGRPIPTWSLFWENVDNPDEADWPKLFSNLNYLFLEAQSPLNVQSEMENNRAQGKSPLHSLNPEVWLEEGLPAGLAINSLGAKDALLTANEMLLAAARNLYPEENYQHVGEIPRGIKNQIRNNPEIAPLVKARTDLQLAKEAESELDRDVVAVHLDNKRIAMYQDEQLLANDIHSGRIPYSAIPSRLSRIQQQYANGAETIMEVSNLKEYVADTEVMKAAKEVSESYDKADEAGTINWSLWRQINDDIEATYGAEIMSKVKRLFEKDISQHPPDIQAVLLAQQYVRDTDYYNIPDEEYDRFVNGLGSRENFADLIMSTPMGASVDRADALKKADDVIATLRAANGGELPDRLVEFQAITRQTQNAQLADLYKALISDVDKLITFERQRRKEDDWKLDVAAVTYLGAKPLLKEAYRTQRGVSEWNESLLPELNGRQFSLDEFIGTNLSDIPLHSVAGLGRTLNMDAIPEDASFEDFIREICFHPETADRYIKMIEMQRGLLPINTGPTAPRNLPSDMMLEPEERKPVTALSSTYRVRQ